MRYSSHTHMHMLLKLLSSSCSIMHQFCNLLYLCCTRLQAHNQVLLTAAAKKDTIGQCWVNVRLRTLLQNYSQGSDTFVLLWSGAPQCLAPRLSHVFKEKVQGHQHSRGCNSNITAHSHRQQAIIFDDHTHSWVVKL